MGFSNRIRLRNRRIGNVVFMCPNSYFLLSKEKKESADTPDNLPGFVEHMEEITKAKQRGNNVEKLKFES